MLTIGRGVVDDPFNEHQNGHISEQQDKEEQLRQKFKEETGISLEVPEQLKFLM